jgi:phosphatidylglycerol:prolipoprotein diacylglycerol transferase
MINPVIHTFHILGFEFSLRWYGVIVMLGVIVGSLMVERVLKRYGENPDAIWDALIWVLPIGIIGARLGYVVNDILGGNTRFIDHPADVVRIWTGGLHIYGALVLGAITLLWYLKKNRLDPWLFLDAAGPALLIGQAIGRIANFINQELYGPPTTLPWGINIDITNRLPQFANLPAATRFHPTFAYEMLWNFAAAGLLLWLSRRYEKDIKPGTLFAGWLMAAGVGRVWLELFFRPDQPKIGDSIISYSLVAAALMAVVGAILLMARYKAINVAFAENWEDEYQIAGQEKPEEEPEEEIEDEVVLTVEEEPKPVRKTTRAKVKTDNTEKTPPKKATPRKAASTTKKKTAPKTTKTTTRTKKSS